MYLMDRFIALNQASPRLQTSVSPLTQESGQLWSIKNVTIQLIVTLMKCKLAFLNRKHIQKVIKVYILCIYIPKTSKFNKYQSFQSDNLSVQEVPIPLNPTRKYNLHVTEYISEFEKYSDFHIYPELHCISNLVCFFAFLVAI